MKIHLKQHQAKKGIEIYLSIYLSIFLSNCLSIYLSFIDQRFSTSILPQVARTRHVFGILTWKCCHHSVQFFHIPTSESGSKLLCFVQFDFKMPLVPQRRANFHILTFKSGESMVWFVHFDSKMRFAPQRRAIFHFSSGQVALHPPLSTFRRSRLTNHWKNTMVSRLS